MSALTVLTIAIGLAMDATAVAIGTSITLGGVTRRQTFRFAFHFGLFQAAMPVVGWAAGRGFSHIIEAWDHWIAFALLALIGTKALYEAWRGDPDEAAKRDPTKGLSLVVLSVATSIDALAVGISFAVLDMTIWYPCLVIGVITAALTTTGMLLGARLGARLGQRMRALGGIVLIAIGAKIVIEHLS